ncbi:hypothetical protein Pyn_05670 [Prunus yedoensis var. nudiflora]|uniref:histidine kinase n=1 Tax=Prunus yedoensis var. nudiflora TaxID=2094558 RepID=A0A314ZCV6_PRUYE|nr:hypothetical protein Pyn_05670 [Prunus yedoensis var. nudiflora]
MDIPQASRFLFKQNRVRMIVDCHATPVHVIQDEGLMQPLCLVGSTLRAPHGCHSQYMANMGSIASLALAVIINGNDEEAIGGRNSMRLWGLVVCHHTSARCIPFPLRYACEFLMQAFGLQLNMELQLASQLSEKHVLRTQTLLCDMLLRDTPAGIVTQSPSIMDLVKCDGAALYYQGKYYPLGVTPTEAQIKDIVEWLLVFHGSSTGLSTDSLGDAGYPELPLWAMLFVGWLLLISPRGIFCSGSDPTLEKRSNGVEQSIIQRTRMMDRGCIHALHSRHFGSG